MIGAIAGDMIGKPYERCSIKHKDFDPLVHGFTDDTVLTVAVAHAILTGDDMAEAIRAFANRHPHAGYGRGFGRWMRAWESEPYNSFGNGAAMRVSPVGFAYDTETDVLHHAERSAAVTHNHPEGIKGAQATALSILLARRGADKETIRTEIAGRFGYDLDRTVDAIRPGYRFDVSCQGSVPESIIAFLDSDDWLDAVKNAISLGGDADTMACIAGGIAQAFYKKIPPAIAARALERLTPDLRAVVNRFNEKYGCEF
ncbi:MAG: ADP-ribosylglycohydrolase family protein [Deltaproteobacteria bacterium]|nr:ADP-ribosylglycohydrolase family protein [Deltaproteobacteria bacterium]MBW2355351.1 ADP-ribosylglycohydrolase family protein [Deltaproteobacteria bacterium]